MLMVGSDTYFLEASGYIPLKDYFRDNENIFLKQKTEEDNKKIDFSLINQECFCFFQVHILWKLAHMFL